MRNRGSAYALLEERGDLQGDLFGNTPPVEQLLEHCASMVRELSASGVKMIAITDPDFPAPVATLKSPPLFLFYRGTLDPRDHEGVAIIGSRRVSPQALVTAHAWARTLADAGAPIISGLAAGVDKQAHLGALEGGHRTVAVIGTGINQTYPQDHASLQQKIGAQHLVVSQFLPDAPPSKTSFPMRNAVMAAWARTTLVIEADDRSGAALQARLAAQQGRDLCLHQHLAAQSWANKLVNARLARFVTSPLEVLGEP